jgi:broad specificity phosphatase PhoE
VTRVILWRHGQTAWNSAGRVQGQTDVELTEVGHAQAAAAAPKLAALQPDLLIASDLQRAADTAAALASLTGLQVRFDQRLRERFFGDWQGLLLTEVAERWPETFARWRAGDRSLDANGIEDVDDLAKRVAAAVDEAVAEVPEGATVVLATHGGAAKHGAGSLLGWPAGATRTLAGLDNCHWTDLRFGARGWQLRAHNVG